MVALKKASLPKTRTAGGYHLIAHLVSILFAALSNFYLIFMSAFTDILVILYYHINNNNENILNI